MSVDMYVESIPKEQLEEWLNHGTTKAVFKCLKKAREHYQETILAGQTLNMTSAESTALSTTLLLGKIAGINMLLEIVVEEDN